MILVQDTVPHGMQITNREVVRQVEQIPSFVSLRKFLVNSRSAVQRLVNVAKVVDQHPEAK